MVLFVSSSAPVEMLSACKKVIRFTMGFLSVHSYVEKYSRRIDVKMKQLEFFKRSFDPF